MSERFLKTMGMVVVFLQNNAYQQNLFQTGMGWGVLYSSAFHYTNNDNSQLIVHYDHFNTC